MKRLLLFRHAKAEAHGDGVDDRKRGLIERGRSDAARMALAMRRFKYLPDFVLCSSSLRTRETLEYWSVAIAENPKVQFSDALYLAEPETLSALIRGAPDKSHALMVVAHNPGIEQAATAYLHEELKRKERDHADQMEEKFPTAALAVIDFEADSWKSVRVGTGKLVDFIRPKDL